MSNTINLKNQEQLIVTHSKSLSLSSEDKKPKEDLFLAYGNTSKNKMDTLNS